MSQHKDKKTGKWYYTGKYRDITGKRRDYKGRGYDTKKAAAQAEELFLQKLKGGYGRIRFDALCAIFNEEGKKIYKTPTLKSYKSMQEDFMLPYFKNKFIDSITPLDISKWSEHCANLKKKNGTPRCGEGYLNNQFSLLDTMFRFAVNQRFIQDNPCVGATKHTDPNALPQEEHSKDNYWEVEEYKHFMDTVEDEERKEIYKMLFDTGLRVGELVVIDWDVLDLTNQKLKVKRTYQSSTGKISSPKTKRSLRVIDIPNRLNDMLKERYERQKKLDGFNKYFYVFGGPIMIEPATIRHFLDKDIDHAGVKRITPHGFRHSHASYLLSNPLVSEALVAERMGHSVDVLRKTYAHIYEKHRSNMLNVLDIL